jgi:hypothetical protein
MAKQYGSGASRHCYSSIMSFEPEAVRAFEHAGWQHAAAAYEESFAPATAPFIKPLLDTAEITAGSRVLDVDWIFPPP